MGSESRRLEIVSNKNDERISMLPDVIIGEILSLIPTKQAVATSVLSKRWQYLWTLVKNLDFEFFNEYDRKDDTTFVKFVDRVTSKCKAQELHRFYLGTDCCKSHVPRWVNEAMIRNVQKLELRVPQCPGNVFTCRSLTSLGHYVHLNYVVNVPDSFYLPKLKVLSILFFGDTPIGLAQKLVSCCPALEDFSMRCFLGLQTTFVISLPLLKRLTMYTTCHSEYTLVIDAPQLQFLEIRTSLHVPSYVIKNLASTVEAVINVGEYESQATEKGTLCNVELLNRLTEVKSLTLGSRTLRGLSNVDVPKKLPIFNKLTLLKLAMGPFYGGEIMCHLLQSSPSLEVFIVEMDFPDELEGEWIEPQNVPLCLSSHLRVVEIYCLSPRAVRQELEMMKYLLGNGQVLQKFLVKGHVHEEDFCKELLTFSRDCEVQVL